MRFGQIMITPHLRVVFDALGSELCYDSLQFSGEILRFVISF